MARASALDEVIARWRADLPGYARSQLKIATKTDAIAPLRMNPVQQALHDALEAQKRERGKVLCLVAKARKMGVSTYVASRYWTQAHWSPPGAPVRCLVMAQDDATAKTLKKIYATFWEQHEPSLRRRRVRSNDHEEGFAHGAEVTVRTASTTTGTRGGTITRIHGSEVAFWPHAEKHTLGALNQLATEVPGTEIILESTANGALGAWYERWRAAQAVDSEWMPLFFPWTMMPEYCAASVPPGFTLSRDKPNDLIPSEHEYAEQHGCTLEQMAWRRAKIVNDSQDGQDGALAFAQEFPITAEESFLTGSADSFIPSSHVAAARMRNQPLVGDVRLMPLLLGIDPAPEGGSSATALIRRRGGIAYDLERLRQINLPTLLDRVYRAAMEEKVDLIGVDATEHMGQELVRALSNMAGLGGKVVGIVFGAAAQNPVLYANRRAEIYDRLRRWIPEGQIPDEHPPPGQPSLSSELLSITRRIDEKRLLLVRKEDIKKKLGFSPDGSDALACTFPFAAEPLGGITGNFVAKSEALDALDGGMVYPAGRARGGPVDGNFVGTFDGGYV